MGDKPDYRDLIVDWPRRHGVKVREAVAAINEAIAPREVTAPWLYVNVK